MFGCVFPDPQLGAKMCISGPCWTRTHGPELPDWGRGSEWCYPVRSLLGKKWAFRPFQIILAGHWSGGTQVLIVNCLRKSYIFQVTVLCQGILSQWGEWREQGWELERQHLWASRKASTQFSEMLRDQYPVNAVDITFSNYLHFQVFFGIPCFFGFQMLLLLLRKKQSSRFARNSMCSNLNL